MFNPPRTYEGAGGIAAQCTVYNKEDRVKDLESEVTEACFCEGFAGGSEF